MPSFCTRCGSSLSASAACANCAAQALPAQAQRGPELVLSKIVATGRTKTAGLVLGAAGAAVALSAFLPWVSALGIFSARPSGGGVLVLLVVGAALSFLAAQVLRNKATKVVRVLLWVLAAIDTLAVFGFFAALKAADQVGGPLGGVVGDVVRPAAGFYFALIGLIASVVGTIVLQTTKSASSSVQVTVGAYPTAGPAPTSQPQTIHPTPSPSPDPQHWFDGITWRPLSETTPARGATRAD